MLFEKDRKKLIQGIKKETLREALRLMLMIRNFEVRAESAYQQGKIGGFFHSYIGQEAIQVAAILAMGSEHWFTTTYRCHALALLLQASPKELMAELYGKKTGNAKGRGGSMHFFTPKMLGGLAIVGGHVPLATGAAFSLKYRKEKNRISICFLGDGAVAQGAFHESLNLASLWKLPALYVIENNHWGMGTAVDRAICVKKMAEKKAHSYGIQGYTLDGMDFFQCYDAFNKLGHKVNKEQSPILVEAVTERFRGHSISDPGLYRSKEDLQKIKKRDPIVSFKEVLIQEGIIDEGDYKQMDTQERKKMIEAMEYADASPWPDSTVLEEDVFAP